MHKIQVKIPVYDFKCNIVIADDVDATIKVYLKRFKMAPEEDHDEFHGLSIFTPKKEYYIFYSIHSLTPSILVHEICHIVDYMLEERDIEKMGESRAYITGYIVEKVFDYVLKHKLLISKHLDFIQKPALVAEGSKAPVCNTVQPLVQIQPSAQNQIDGSKES